MPNFGFFEYQKQLTLLEKAGEPLIALHKMIGWQKFCLLIDQGRETSRKSPAGTKGFQSLNGWDWLFESS